jgi:hypothetical protein
MLLEQSGRVVSTLPSYSGNLGQRLTEVSRSFPSHARQIREQYLKLGHGRFLPYPLQQIITFNHIIRRYSLVY